MNLASAFRYLGPPVDMWAMGVLLYYMLVGCLPFRGRTVTQLRKAILEGTAGGGLVHVPPRVSQGAAALIRKLLSRNPKTRPRAAKLIEEATRVASPLRPLSVDRLVATGGNYCWRRTQPWLAKQVFPAEYPRFSMQPGSLDACSALADASKRASRILLSPSLMPAGKRPEVAHETSLSTRTSASGHLDVNPGVAITNAKSTTDLNERVNTRMMSASEDVIAQSEVEAARLLLQLGIASDRLGDHRNSDARSSITGAYRIMLHQLQRCRRLSNLPPFQDDGTESGISTETPASQGTSSKPRMKKSPSDIPYQGPSKHDKSCSVM
uniref:Protein kinase domain-containing protein n=1 Tax=Mesocestoides corti TaxID=53468 RepID=A0A5K3EW11_MESCO